MKKYRGNEDAPPRVLKYRSQVKALLPYQIASAIIVFLGSTILTLIYVYDLYKGHNLDIIELSGLVFIYAIFFVTIYQIRKTLVLASTRIQAYEDKLVIRTGKLKKKKRVINYKDIVSIKSKVNAKVGGWFTLILKNKKCYRVLITLERSDYILDAIVNYNPSLMSKKKFLKLRENVIMLDHRLARLKNHFFAKKYRRALLLIICLFLVAIYLLYTKQSREFFIYSPFTHLLSTLVVMGGVFLVSYSIFNSFTNKSIDENFMENLKKNPDRKARDMDFEFKIQKKFFPMLITPMAFLLVFVFMTDINTLGRVSVFKSSKDLGVSAEESFWYDSRYNCIDCKYSLKNNDLIVWKSQVGKIVGIPSEIVSVNKKNDKGRFIASVQEVKVPGESFAIKLIDGKTIIVRNRDIEGKAFKEIPHFK